MVSIEEAGPLPPPFPTCAHTQMKDCVGSRTEASKSSEIVGAVSGEVRAFRRLNGGRETAWEPARQSKFLAAGMMPPV